MLKRDPTLRDRVVRIARATELAAGLTPSPAARAFDLLAGRPVEALAVGVCDASEREIATYIVSEGTATFVPADARMILRSVVRHLSAAGFWIAHNHPGGTCAHSHEDREFARYMARAGETLGLRFLGSLVVVDNGGADYWKP